MLPHTWCLTQLLQIPKHVKSTQNTRVILHPPRTTLHFSSMVGVWSRITCYFILSNVVAFERICVSDFCGLTFGFYTNFVSYCRISRRVSSRLGIQRCLTSWGLTQLGPSLLSPPYCVERFAGILVTPRAGGSCFRLTSGLIPCSTSISIRRRYCAELNRFDRSYPGFGFAVFVCDVRPCH